VNNLSEVAHTFLQGKELKVLVLQSQWEGWALQGLLVEDWSRDIPRKRLEKSSL